LGPTQLLILINDVPDFVNALPKIRGFADDCPSITLATAPLFADDTTMMCVALTEQLLMSALNAAMSEICTWLKTN